MMSGHTPTCRNSGTAKGSKPEQVEDRRRVGRGEVPDPAEERCVPHVDGDEQHLVEREEHRDLQQDRQATRGRVYLLVLVKRHQLLLLLDAVVLEAVADLLHLGLQLLHLGHQLVALVGQREERELDEHGRGEDGEAVVAEHLRQPVQQAEQRLGDEVEPAPVDQQVELLGAGLLAVGVDQRHLLGAGEQVVGSGPGTARRDHHVLCNQVLGLEPILGRLDAAELRVIGDLLVGDQRRRPVLVGDAEPSRRRLLEGTVSALL